MNTNTSIACDQILDTALRLGADKKHWEDLQLYEVADELGITLAQLSDCYSQKDALTDALFDRATRAMLEQCGQTKMLPLPMRDRLYVAVTTWLDSLAPHRTVARQMLKYKLEFGHIHLQVLELLRISRTVQWVREVCICEATDAKRIMEEVVLSSIFVMTFTFWLWDDSANQQRTREKLENLLKLSEKGATLLNKYSLSERD
ncbi:MAG: TetR/AcrR family transcriptional regulator [Gammaproteobacteria bacterium]|jgi:AcrR family transcriptional regulator